MNSTKIFETNIIKSLEEAIEISKELDIINQIKTIFPGN